MNVRPRVMEGWLAAEFPPGPRREVLINAEHERLDARTVTRAIRRTGKNGVVDMGPGRFEGFVVDRRVELSSREGDFTEVGGVIRVTGGPVILRGLTLRPQAGESALVVGAVSVFLEDCDVQGLVETGHGSRLYARNCRFASSEVGVIVGGGAEAEFAAARVTGAPVGLLVNEGGHCAVYGSRIEGCVGSPPGGPGAGIYSHGHLYSEGVEFFRNDVGVYLKGGEFSTLLACHFAENTEAGLVTEAAGSGLRLDLRGCDFEASDGATCALLALQDVEARLDTCGLAAVNGAALSLRGGSLDAEACRVASAAGAAAELLDGTVAGRACRFLSERGCGVRVERAQGSLSGGTIEGSPPIIEAEPRALKLSGVTVREPGVAVALPHATAATESESIDGCLATLEEIVGQPSAKEELRRLVRLAYAARERKRHGVPPSEESFSGIFVGPPGCGKFAAARVFAEALHAMGELQTPHVVEVSLAGAAVADPTAITASMVFVRTGGSGGISLKSPGTAEALLRLVRSLDGRGHVILDGEREMLSAFVRSRPELAREFPLELVFSAYGPPELAELFAAHCRREKIPMGPEAARRLTVVMHSLHDRRQKRYIDLEGVAGLFAEARRNYLERCTREGRFDLPLDGRDIAAPLDPATNAALARLPEIVTVCPHCSAENPWLPGLASDQRCLSCGQHYPGPWGLWRSSTYFRKRRERGEGLRSGGVARHRMAVAETAG